MFIPADTHELIEQAKSGDAAAFRQLAVPVIGRITDQTLIFDLRCLEDEDAFARNLANDALNRRPEPAE